MRGKTGHKSSLILSILILSGFFQACSTSERTGGPEVYPTQKETVLPDTLNIRIPGSEVAFRMIPLPGGESTLGSSDPEESRPSDEGPAVSVQISPFWMAETEVTYDAFAIFRFKDRDSDSTNIAGKTLPVDAVARPSTPYEDPSFGMDGSGYPAVGMTQWGALQYARWLTEKTGIFFRLPTEAEWEYACLSGGSNDTSKGYTKGTLEGSPFGIGESRIEEHAWFTQNSDDRIQQVASKRPNPSGFYDMNGNVAEWTLDQYDEKFYGTLSAGESPVVDPWRIPDKRHPRTVRGGYYSSEHEEVRCSRRVKSNMRWKRRDPQIPKSFWWNTDSPFVGFRLVAPVHPPAPREQKAFWSLVLGE